MKTILCYRCSEQVFPNDTVAFLDHKLFCNKDCALNYARDLIYIVELDKADFFPEDDAE